MEKRDREKLVSALAFALDAHGDQKRKGKDVPYVSHLLQVAGHVLEYGGDVELAVAGLLHDTLEDCAGVSRDAIEERFGSRVARIVTSLTDLLEGDVPGQKSGWQARKEQYLAHLRTAPRDARLVAACDKLHNLTNIVADLRTDGPESLARFSAAPERILWYHDEVRKVVGEDLPGGLLTELDGQLAALRSLIAPA